MLLIYIIASTLLYAAILRQQFKEDDELLVEDFIVFFAVSFVPIINLFALFLFLDHIRFFKKKLFVKKSK